MVNGWFTLHRFRSASGGLRARSPAQLLPTLFRQLLAVFEPVLLVLRRLLLGIFETPLPIAIHTNPPRHPSLRHMPAFARLARKIETERFSFCFGPRDDLHVEDYRIGEGGRCVSALSAD